jgi:hypothetical protein
MGQKAKKINNKSKRTEKTMENCRDCLNAQMQVGVYRDRFSANFYTPGLHRVAIRRSGFRSEIWSRIQLESMDAEKATFHKKKRIMFDHESRFFSVHTIS